MPSLANMPNMASTPSAAALATSGAARQERLDLYLLMMRQDNPSFGCFTEEQIVKGAAMAAVPLPDGTAPAPAAASATAEERDTYACITQKGSPIEELYLGQDKGTLFLWASGSKINWVARMDGYPSETDAMYAAQGMYAATQAWNKALKGRAEFVYVTSFDDACFQLRYGGDKGGVLAQAFFPDQHDVTLNDVWVYKRQFDADQRALIANTFAHELGHVLGLRHEHAQHSVPGTWGKPEDDGRMLESILFGTENQYSVMAYYSGQQIQDSDARDLVAAMDTLEDGLTLQGRGVGNTTITKTVRRVMPDN